MSDYDAAANGAACYALAIATMRDKLESLHKVQIGDCTLYRADCRDVLPLLPRVDAVVTDPPYGLELGFENDKRGGSHGLAKKSYDSYDDSLKNFRSIVSPAIATSLKIASRGAVFCNHNLHELPKPDAIGGIFIPSAMGRHCWGFNSFSPVGFYGVAPRLNQGSRASAIKSSETSGNEHEHPCVKPLGWMLWLVGHAASVAETVLDPFMGSGTTGVACVKLGRKFIGIELDPGYFDIACRRIEKAYEQPDLFVAPPVTEIQTSFLEGA